ncbi:MAG: ComF family protein [Clostridia bacterium]|nr:ComF family protein [Clostridia bacterium]
MDKFFLLETIMNYIFPPTCGFCEEITGSDSFICEDCKRIKKQEYINHCCMCGKVCYSEICPECRKKKIYYDKFFFCYEYNEDIKEKIHRYKFLGEKYYYHFFTEMLYERLKNETADGIVAVPISHERMQERGYNQCELIAKKLSRMLKIPYLKGALVKVVHNERQSLQTFKLRKESVKNVFQVADIYDISGKKILLIDDILASGSTVNECSRILKQAKVKEVKVGVIAVSHILNRL